MKYYIASFVFYSFYLILKTNKSLQMLQQNRYNRGNKYLKWLKEHLKKHFLTIELGFLLLPIFFFLNEVGRFIIMNVFYGICFMRLFDEQQKEQTKIPLKFTGRIKRLYTTTILLYLIAILIGILGKESIWPYFGLSILLYLNSLVVVLANLINAPIEHSINNHFKRMAMQKLKSLSHLEVIGITGSYGKTSSKNILNDVLNVKFNALASPKNYNTPTGLMITVNEYLDKFNDYFIAEMGACKTKEIQELCDFVHPKYGILTKIGVAHLETFGSQENITKTKFELIESLPKDGIGILNADDPLQVNYALKNDVKIIWIGIENVAQSNIYADHIKLSPEGTTFDCHFKMEENKVITFTTKLLGKANIYNILAAIALGHSLGLTDEELILGVKKVKPVEHRLQLKKYYDMYLIDDAYNANPDGCKMALDVLNLMKGEKMVITSGMIELGEKSDELNKNLGEKMAEVADKVILIGKEQTKPIQEGLKNKHFKEQNMILVNHIQEALTYLEKNHKKNTYILLQSDLPDTFNES